MGRQIKITKHNKSITWLSIIALMIQALALGTYLPNYISSATAAANTDGLSSYIICTPSGTRLVTLDDTGQPVEEETTSTVTISCTLCSNPVSADGVYLNEIDHPKQRTLKSAPLTAALSQACRGVVKGVFRKRDPPLNS